MKIIKVEFYEEDPSYCRTTFVDKENDRYYHRNFDNTWDTTYPSGGYMESCDSIKDEVTFHVVDSAGNVHHAEVVGKPPTFVPIHKKMEQVIEDFIGRLGLTSKDDWSKWLAAEMGAHNYKSYHSWLGYETKDVPDAGIGEEHGHILEKFSYFGTNFNVRAVSREHKICNKKWVEVSIFSGIKNRIRTCGYILDETEFRPS